MKTTLYTLLLLCLACSSPKYTYYFDRAPDPASGLAPEVAGENMRIEKESLVAATSPAPEVIAPAENVAVSVDVREDPPSTTARPVTRKMMRQELRSLAREIRKAKSTGFDPTGNKRRTENPRNNGFAIAGFVLSLTGMLVLWPLVILGVIFSAIGLNSERKGLAIAGLIIGIVGIILVLIIAQQASLN